MSFRWGGDLARQCKACGHMRSCHSSYLRGFSCDVRQCDCDTFAEPAEPPKPKAEDPPQ